MGMRGTEHARERGDRRRVRFGVAGIVAILTAFGCGGGVASPSTSAGPSLASPTTTAGVSPSVATPTAAPTLGPGQFGPTGSMTVARQGPTATLLQDGRVLVACGSSDNAAELYDPKAGTFGQTGPMAAARTSGATATLLENGRVLIAGGNDRSLAQPLASAELYDPGAGKFADTGPMSAARVGHTATLLQNGRVLIAGGFDASGNVLATAELYDPATGKFAPTGSMAHPRAGHTAVVLQSGLVLIVGGSGAGGVADKAPGTAELYDPSTGKFLAAGSLKTARYSGHAATLTPNGQVLIAGGNSSDVQETPLASAELYSPTTGQFTPTGSMAVARDGLTATLLGDGKILVAGGAENSAEVYDPARGVFAPTGSTAVVRSFASATLLQDGRVLVVGGASDPAYANSAELYRP
jgi:hypothetical protein